MRAIWLVLCLVCLVCLRFGLRLVCMYWFPALVSLLLYSPGLISVVCWLVWVFVDCYAVVLLVASLNWHGVVFGVVCVSVLLYLRE